MPLTRRHVTGRTFCFYHPSLPTLHWSCSERQKAIRIYFCPLQKNLISFVNKSLKSYQSSDFSGTSFTLKYLTFFTWRLSKDRKKVLSYSFYMYPPFSKRSLHRNMGSVQHRETIILFFRVWDRGNNFSKSELIHDTERTVRVDTYCFPCSAAITKDTALV